MKLLTNRSILNMEKATFDRLITEFNENNERALKLRNFILDKDKFSKVDQLNADLLIAQLKAMEAYLSCLSIRIGLNAPREEVAKDTTNPDNIEGD